MTAFRLISLPIHGALEMFLGLALMAAPFALGFGDAGLVSAVLVGALLVGLALIATVSTPDSSLPVQAHHTFDWTLVVALLGAAAILGFHGDRASALGFTAIGLAQLMLALTTRYSRAR